MNRFFTAPRQLAPAAIWLCLSLSAIASGPLLAQQQAYLGDLYVDVRVAPHDVFKRDGDDVHMVLPIAIHEAALGARIEVTTPDGVVRVRVPPGTQSGQRFRLRERGVPTRAGGRGDLVVEVRLALPRVLDERSKQLLREFGRINGETVRF